MTTNNTTTTDDLDAALTAAQTELVRLKALEQARITQARHERQMEQQRVEQAAAKSKAERAAALCAEYSTADDVEHREKRDKLIAQLQDALARLAERKPQTQWVFQHRQALQPWLDDLLAEKQRQDRRWPDLAAALDFIATGKVVL